jgi:hypothetical protein
MCGAGTRLGQLECRVPTPSAIAFVISPAQSGRAQWRQGSGAVVFDFRILGGEQMSGDRCRERWFSSV